MSDEDERDHGELFPSNGVNDVVSMSSTLGMTAWRRCHARADRPHAPTTPSQGN